MASSRRSDTDTELGTSEESDTYTGTPTSNQQDREQSGSVTPRPLPRSRHASPTGSVNTPLGRVNPFGRGNQDRTVNIGGVIERDGGRQPDNPLLKVPPYPNPQVGNPLDNYDARPDAPPAIRDFGNNPQDREIGGTQPPPPTRPSTEEVLKNMKDRLPGDPR